MWTLSKGANILVKRPFYSGFRPGSIPSLHQAVLDEDLSFIAKNRGDPEYYLPRDSYGFTAKELALLLGKIHLAKELGYRPLSHVLFQDRDKEKRVVPAEEFEERFMIKLIPTTSFTSLEEMKEGIRQCPFSYRYTGLGHEMRRKGSLYLSEIMKGYITACSVRYIDAVKGFGLFAEKRLCSGEWIGEYAGVVKELAAQELDTTYIYHYPTRFFSFRLFGIDAKESSNLMRFANHSDNPNAVMECLYDRGLLHMALFAKQEIAPGEEITVNYGREYWIRRVKGKE